MINLWTTACNKLSISEQAAISINRMIFSIYIKTRHQASGKDRDEVTASGWKWTKAITRKPNGKISTYSNIPIIHPDRKIHSDYQLCHQLQPCPGWLKNAPKSSATTRGTSHMHKDMHTQREESSGGTGFLSQETSDSRGNHGSWEIFTANGRSRPPTCIYLYQLASFQI